MSCVKNIIGEREWHPVFHELMDYADWYFAYKDGSSDLSAVIRFRECDDLSEPYDAWFIRNEHEYPATRAFVEWIISK